jgi:alanine racemase
LAEKFGFKGLKRMTAGSHAVLAHPETHCDSVNPGRCLFGRLEGKWAEKIAMRKVISSIKSHVIQIKEFATNDVIGYLGPSPLSEPKKLAVIPIGFGDGFNHLPPLGEVLIAGIRAPLVTRRGIEHMVIDVTHIPHVNVGEEVVLLGKQGSGEITAEELCRWVELPMLELLPRLARTLPHLYLK